MRAKLLPGEGAARAALLFSALGDETRLALVSRLSGGQPMSIRSLTGGTRVTRQAVTKHLRVMERAGLLHSVRRGRERLWRVDRRRLEAASRHLGAIAGQWDKALARLARHVEG